jgi:hypothetical protein
VPTVRSQAPEIVRPKASGIHGDSHEAKDRTGECLSGAGFAAKAAIRRQLNRTTATWVIPETYEDQGISGAKGRDQRPAFDTTGLVAACSTS